MVNVADVIQRFQNQEQAIAYLEDTRWNGTPVCPYCGSDQVGRHASGDRDIARWQCRSCLKSFSVLIGTIFQGTRLPLVRWFMVLSIIMNAKKKRSAYQIAGDLGMRRPTVSIMMKKISVVMQSDPKQVAFLKKIVESDCGAVL